MAFKAWLRKILKKHVYNPKWRCVHCGKEIFDEKYYCEDCYNELPYILPSYCQHCGRKTVAPEEYCDTCKNTLVSLDKCRSAFSYEGIIKPLIQRAKYEGEHYVWESFVSDLAFVYLKNYFNADALCYVPMTEKRLKKRGYNQGRVIAELLSAKINVPVIHCLEKTKETPRQATLKRTQRIKNLVGVFKITDRSQIKDKTILIVDDVSTTGATAQAMAEKLKSAGANYVYLITVASVPTKDYVKQKKRT